LIYAAVLLTGLGGLLIELVLVRRFGLLLGNTSEASALVIGAYLLGLGVGGLLVQSLLRRGVRPLRTAALLYAVVAVASWLLDQLVAGLPPLPALAGVLLVLITPGIPTLLMGLAFPLIFTALGRGAQMWRTGALVALNLLGSLVATAFGANLWIPELGLGACSLLASGVYLMAAGLLLVPAAREQEPTREAVARRGPLPALGGLALAAGLGGALVVGLQVALLRRLPFFLEGFQPTLSGVLASCLLGLTLGASLGAPLLGRLFRERAVAAALLIAVACLGLGLQERIAPLLAQIPVTSEFHLHARIWLCALIAAGPICFALGAVVPLCLARFADPEVRSAVAGRLFFWQGVGSLAGSLFVGEALPWLFPERFFVVVPLALAAPSVVLLVLVRQARWVTGGPVLVFVLIASLVGISGPGTLRDPAPPLARPGAPAGPLRFLEHRTDSVVTASAAYDRRRHSMVLYTNEFRAAETGPFADYMQVLGLLPFLLRDGLERAAVVAFGTGTTAEAVTLWPSLREIHLVEISRAVFHLAPQFAGEGPLARTRTPDFLRDPRVEVHLTDGRRFLARHEPSSLDLVTMEPLLPYSPGTAALYTQEFYELVRRVLTPRGLVVQWVPTHAVPAAYYDSILATFARSLPHHSVWFLDGATILIGSLEPHLPEPATLAARLPGPSHPASAVLHEARITSVEDLLAAYVGDDLLSVAGDAASVSDERPFIERVGAWKYDGSHRHFYHPNFSLLLELAARGGHGPLDRPAWTTMRTQRLRGYRHLRDATRHIQPLESARKAAEEIAEARRVLPESVLLFHEETLALRFAAELELVLRRGRSVGDLVTAHLARDSGSAMLQAALALTGGPEGEAALAPEAAVARATAIAPYFFERPPDFLRRLPAPDAPRSPLEDVEFLPEGPELARLASTDDPLAVALRAAYRVRVARALLEVLAERPLGQEERLALAPLLDPALMRQAVEVVAARSGSLADEVAPLWRPDLPAPEALQPFVDDTPANHGISAGIP
jgi:predicted membrane-bound spermidine synthase